MKGSPEPLIQRTLSSDNPDMIGSRWVLVITGLVVAALGVALAVTSAESANRLSGAVGGIAGVAALGFSIWVWVEERSSRPHDGPRRESAPLRIGHTLPPSGNTLAERLSLRTPRLATIWGIPVGIVVAIDDGMPVSLIVGFIFVLPYALLWLYGLRRKSKSGRWIIDAVVGLMVFGWTILISGLPFETSGPNHLWITPPTLLVLAGIGWVATGSWLARIIRDLRK